jgi:hypothetical protein
VPFAVEVERDVPETVSGPSEAAEIGHGAVVPEQGVQGLEREQQVRIEAGTLARPARNLAAVVDSERDTIGIAGRRS